MRNAMNYRMIARIISPILMIEAIFMIPAWAISYAGGEANAADAIVKSQFIIIACAAVLYLASRNARKGFYAKEGLVTTGFSWIIMSAHAVFRSISPGKYQAISTVCLRWFQASRQRVLRFSRKWNPFPEGFCTGAASATGWAAWACWYS